MTLEDSHFSSSKVLKKSAKGEYQIKLADGIILDRGGVSRVATMDFDNIQRLQIGLLADDEFWLKASSIFCNSTLELRILRNKKTEQLKLRFQICP